MHGDLGRTEPSICTLLNKECDIIELDVEVNKLKDNYSTFKKIN